MKKILLTLSFVFTILIMNGQPQTISISGTVSGSTGGGIPSYPVQIMSDSTMGFMYFGTATTNANGNYSHSVTLPVGMTQGLFYVSTQDSCTGQFYVQAVSFSPASMNIAGVNFTMCQNSGSNCAASFTHSTSGSTVTFNSNATGGQAPYVYSWSFGDGTSATSANPTHTYNVMNGTFLACLTVTDAAGCSTSYCDTIVISGSGSGSCTALFSQSQQGNTVNFTSNSTGGNPFFPLLHIWDFGDGTNSYVNNPSHIYSSPGTYLVCLTVTDSICFATYCDTVVIAGASCSSSFSTSVMDSLVTFTPQVTGTAPFTYAWNFGDGNTGNSANPTYVYTANGTYMACLTVTDVNGCTSTSCNFITITAFQSSGCAASFTYQAAPASGIVYFNGVATGGVGPYSYSWDFGDGNTGTGQNSGHLYMVMGVYTACLTITDTLGCTATYCDSLFAYGVGVACSVSFTYQANALGSISFTSFPTGTAPFSYVWDFGDGTTSTQANPTHTYLPPSTTYSVTLTVTDNNGCISTYSGIVVSAGGNPCQASFTHTVNGNTASFVSNISGGTAPYSYYWDFNDGNTSFAQNPNHTYANNGVYGVCLTIADSLGCFSVYCDTIFVNTGSGSVGNLSGMVLTDTLAQAAVVHLISYDSITSSFTVVAVDTVQGFFNFYNVPSGDYLVRAALLSADPQYANYLPTYYTQTLYWTNATTVTVSPNVIQFVTIPLIQGSNSSNTAVGQNFVGGGIALSIFRGGGAAPNVPVFILEQNMNPFDYTYTDINGDYSFTNLPNGVYYIYVEEMGLLSTPIQVTVNDNTPTIDNVDFVIETYYVTHSRIQMQCFLLKN